MKREKRRHREREKVEKSSSNNNSNSFLSFECCILCSLFVVVKPTDFNSYFVWFVFELHLLYGPERCAAAEEAAWRTEQTQYKKKRERDIKQKTDSSIDTYRIDSLVLPSHGSNNFFFRWDSSPLVRYTVLLLAVLADFLLVLVFVRIFSSLVICSWFSGVRLILFLLNIFCNKYLSNQDMIAQIIKRKFFRP